MKRNQSIHSLLNRSLVAGLLLVSLSGFKGSAKTGRPVRVVSLCFPNKELKEIVPVVDEEGSRGCDIIVLPETWQGQATPETLDGAAITTLSKLAEKHHTYIITPIDRTDGKNRYNSAVLIDRNGKVVFVYDKVYPYWSELGLKTPVTPGSNGEMVFDADFGRIGFAICYDANFPEIWQVLREKRAELVFWSSAYSAGTQLRAYALLHHYYIVSSTQSRDCQMYDITGERILDMTGGDVTVARATLDLDRGLYHENFNINKRDKLLKEHGIEVEEEIHMPREQWFVLRALKPAVSARELAKKYGLEELIDYQDRSRKEINKKRGFDFGKRYLSE